MKEFEILKAKPNVIFIKASSSSSLSLKYILMASRRKNIWYEHYLYGTNSFFSRLSYILTKHDELVFHPGFVCFHIVNHV